jgi:hypothetical protein
MVSSVLDMTAEQLAVTLGTFRETYADDAEYRELRQQFPADWPM